MIEQLTIRGFRGFQEFEVHGLGRINLLVGLNNCGKTSILEAVQLCQSVGDLTALWQIASRRGERFYDNTENRISYTPDVDICHLFHGHEIEVGSSFEIIARSAGMTEEFSATIIESQNDQTLFDESVNDPDELSDEQELAIELTWASSNTTRRLPLSSRGGVPGNILRRYERHKIDTADNVKFISTAGLNIDDVVRMFEEIVLTREEELVTQALRTIEPTIERIATLSGDRRRSRPDERGGIVIRTKDSDQRLPIGSMGDGMWRTLGLALSIVSAQKGTLLVDEIDTGLHYSVLESVWKLIDRAAKRLNVQVFSTSHSRDAYESLASIAHSKVSGKDQVTIQRIERSKIRSVAYTEQEIIASANRGNEVR